MHERETCYWMKKEARESRVSQRQTNSRDQREDQRTRGREVVVTQECVVPLPTHDYSAISVTVYRLSRLAWCDVEEMSESNGHIQFVIKIKGEQIIIVLFWMSCSYFPFDCLSKTCQAVFVWSYSCFDYDSSWVIISTCSCSSLIPLFIHSFSISRFYHLFINFYHPSFHSYFWCWQSVRIRSFDSYLQFKKREEMNNIFIPTVIHSFMTRLKNFCNRNTLTYWETKFPSTRLQ